MYGDFFGRMVRKTNSTVYMVVADGSHGGGQDRARGRPVVDAGCLRGEDPFQEAASGRVHKSPSMKDHGGRVVLKGAMWSSSKERDACCGAVVGSSAPAGASGSHREGF